MRNYDCKTWIVEMWARQYSGPRKQALLWSFSHKMTKKQAKKVAVNRLKEEMLDSDQILWMDKNSKAIIVNEEGDHIFSIFATIRKVG